MSADIEAAEAPAERSGAAMPHRGGRDSGGGRLVPAASAAGAAVLWFMPAGAGINEDCRASFDVRQSKERQLPTLPPGGAVPSAMAGLTSLFGMGRGGSPPL